MKLINRAVLIMISTLSVAAFAGGVDRISFNSNGIGSAKTYDVWCTNGSHGYVNVSGSYVSWVGRRSGNTYNISVGQAASNLCQ